MSTAREEILNRIRNANGPQRLDRRREYEAVISNYLQASILSSKKRMDLFVDRLHDYGAVVYPCAEQQIAEAIRDTITKREKTELLVPPALPAAWLPEDLRFVLDSDLEYGEIDASQGVLTGCAIAIAITGTIVLRHSAGEGRRALTLIPDYHLCVVLASQVVGTVAEGIRTMANFENVPLTTISGPSATSDIEMTRIKGVHGPRTLDVILAE